jgi:mRNA (guanine-N7-)-methyltransferase
MSVSVSASLSLPLPRFLTHGSTDIATISINQARDRWGSLKSDRFDAWFSQLDAYHNPLENAATLPPEALSRPFDVVTMQFCMHYAFETESAVHQMLDNVARYLRKGGRFIGTIPNPDFLMYVHPIPGIPVSSSLLSLLCTKLWLTDVDVAADRAELDKIPERAPLEYGNNVYRVKFDTRHRPNADYYGHRYHFYLEDAVGDVPEFVVYWSNFETCVSLALPSSPFLSPWPNLRLISAYRPWIHSIAKQHNLRLLYKREFHHIYVEESQHPEYGPLLRRMKVVNEREESAMDEEQWDAAGASTPFLCLLR